MTVTQDHFVGAAAVLVCVWIALILARVALERRGEVFDRAHRQRMAMIDEMASASQSVDEFTRLADALDTVSLDQHAKALREGRSPTSVYPVELWGIVKAVEGVR